MLVGYLILAIIFRAVYKFRENEIDHALDWQTGKQKPSNTNTNYENGN